jgi:hypothetical protein
MNDVSCQICHADPASGGGSTKAVTRFGIAPSGPNGFDPLDGSGPSGLSLGGSLQQALAINPTCLEVVPTIAGGFPVDANIEIHRVTPPAFGAGLVESIDDADILYWEANPPHPWITGYVHMLHPAEDPFGPLRAGRFGWKAQEATVMSFSSGASLNELGITNDFAMTENMPNGDAAKLAACDAVPEPEDVADGFGFRRIDRMTDFQRFLGVAPQMPKSGMTGETLFTSIGCADCHVATAYTTKTVGVEAALAGKQIKPYSDFLLHDIGTGDGIVQGAATGDVFRTVPLWGLKSRISSGLFHDGRGVDLSDTIDQHLGEASTARSAFQALSAGDQQKVLDFLGSLGQMEFDVDNSHVVDAIDWLSLQPSFTGPGSFFTPDSPTAIADVDQDGDFDLVDFGYMQRAHTN